MIYQKTNNMMATPSVQLIDLVNEMGLPLSIFMSMVLKEKFTQEEVDDLGYMKDKIDIYLEEYEYAGRYFDE